MLSVSAIEFFVISVAVFAVLYWITPKKYCWISFVVLLCMFTWLAFKFTPNSTDDLTRYFWVLDNFREKGIDELNWYISDGKYHWDVYRCMAYYYYFCSRFANNHVMPALTIFISYGSMFVILWRSAKKFNVEKLYLFIGSMFAISTYWYYDTSSGIRNGLAFAIAIFATYFHLVERRYIPLCYALYVVAALCHSAGVLPVVLVMVCVVTLNTDGKFLKYAIMLGIVGGAALIQFLATKTNNSFIQAFAGESESHEATLMNPIGEGTMFKVNVAVLLVMILVAFYFSVFFDKSRHHDELKRFYKYSNLLIYFLIGCMFSGLVFVRFVRWIVPIVGGMLFMIGMHIEREYIEEKGIRYCQYFSPPSISIRVRIRTLVMLLFVAFTGVHFWYLCNGSSLHWLHF